jgi:hypothetical protein
MQSDILLFDQAIEIQHFLQANPFYSFYLSSALEVIIFIQVLQIIQAGHPLVLRFMKKHQILV